LIREEEEEEEEEEEVNELRLKTSVFFCVVFKCFFFIDLFACRVCRNNLDDF